MGLITVRSWDLSLYAFV